MMVRERGRADELDVVTRFISGVSGDSPSAGNAPLDWLEPRVRPVTASDHADVVEPLLRLCRVALEVDKPLWLNTL